MNHGIAKTTRPPRPKTSCPAMRPCLSELLNNLAAAGDGERDPTVADLRDAVGRRAIGPLLLVPGLIVMSPLSGIPVLPSTVAAAVILLVIQLLMGRRGFWLPRTLLRRSIPRDRLERTIRFLTPIARVADRIARPRLRILAEGPAIRVVAVACLALAATMPPLEVFPFLNTAAGTLIALFGLAITAHDGALVLVGLVLSAALIGCEVWLLV
jgi:hypothetical protein